jgi:polyisoprenoid-binding protein YceI
MKNFIFNFLVLSINSICHSAVYKLSADQGQITFLAKGKPALISIKGEGAGASAQLLEKDSMLNGVVSFQLDTLKTGIELRDDHLKNKYLEVEKFPTATLTFSNFKIPDDLTSEIPFNGILNLHGIDQPIQGLVTINKESKQQKLKADFKIKLSQFKIEIPSFKGITVAEDVQIKIEAPIVKEE